MDKSKYKAQMDDIIKISVEKIYQSRELIEKKWLVIKLYKRC
jgi:dGTPase